MFKVNLLLFFLVMIIREVTHPLEMNLYFLNENLLLEKFFEFSIV